MLVLAVWPLPGQNDRARAREAFERGVKDEMEGRLDAALAAYSDAIQADSSFFAARRARGALHLREKRYVEAAADFEAALRLIEGEIEAVRLLHQARSAANPPEPPPQPHALEPGPAQQPSVPAGSKPSENLQSAGRPAAPPGSKAVGITPQPAGAAIQTAPKSAPLAGPRAAEPRHLAGRAAIRAGKLQEALVELTAAVELDPRHALAWNARGYVHLLLKQPEKALEDFNRALEIDPDYLNALVNRSEARRRLGDRQGAAADAARAQEIAGKR